MALTSTFSKILDSHGTISGSALKGAPRAALRLARGVLIAIGIALCSASPAGMAQMNDLTSMDPILCATKTIGELQTECLFRIAIKESNVRYTAKNKTSGAYGAWQFMSKSALNTKPIEQVQLAIDYANYRYGSPCKAWSFWQRNYWW